MSEGKGKLETINDFLIYIVAIIGLIVFILSSLPDTGFAISVNGTILFVLVIVLLLFRHFSKIQIPGLLTLTKKVEEVRDEAKELRISLTQVLAKAQANSTSVINIGHLMKDNAIEAQEIAPQIRTVRKSTDIQNESDRILKLIADKEYVGAFAVIRNKIENQLEQLVETQSGQKPKFRTSIELLRQLNQNSLLSPSLMDAINLVRNTANTLMHSSPDENRISSGEVRIIADLAIKVISELEALKERISKNKEYLIR